MNQKRPYDITSKKLDLSKVPRANEIPHELYRELRDIKAWKDRSANSDVLVS